LNPVSTWWTVGFSWEEFADLTGPRAVGLWTWMSGALAGLAVFAFLTLGLMLLARRRFLREITRPR
jgi:hypothetical protein